MKREKRILLGVTVDFQLRYHDGLAEKLVLDGWEVHLAASPGPWLEKHRNDAGIIVHEIPTARNPNLLADLRALFLWIRVLLSVRPRVTLIGTPKAGLLGMLASWITRVPNRYYELHGLRLEGESGLRRTALTMFEWATCRLATRVIAVGHSLARALIASGAADPGDVIVLGSGSPNGVPVARFQKAADARSSNLATRAEYGVRAGDLLISYVGRITADKGVKSLLDACAALSRRGKTVHLLLVGAVEDSNLAQVSDAATAGGVFVHAVGETALVEKYLAASDVFCLPTRREGLPTVILEAFASKVPVVSTRATGVVDLVRHRETGLLAEIDDAEALADALEELSDSPSLKDRLVAAAFELVAEKYESALVQQRYVDFLRSGESRP